MQQHGCVRCLPWILPSTWLLLLWGWGGSIMYANSLRRIIGWLGTVGRLQARSSPCVCALTWTVACLVFRISLFLNFCWSVMSRNWSMSGTCMVVEWEKNSICKQNASCFQNLPGNEHGNVQGRDRTKGKYSFPHRHQYYIRQSKVSGQPYNCIGVKLYRSSMY